MLQMCRNKDRGPEGRGMGKDGYIKEREKGKRKKRKEVKRKEIEDRRLGTETKER